MQLWDEVRKTISLEKLNENTTSIHISEDDDEDIDEIYQNLYAARMRLDNCQCMLSMTSFPVLIGLYFMFQIMADNVLSSGYTGDQNEARSSLGMFPLRTSDIRGRVSVTKCGELLTTRIQSADYRQDT